MSQSVQEIESDLEAAKSRRCDILREIQDLECQIDDAHADLSDIEGDIEELEATLSAILDDCE